MSLTSRRTASISGAAARELRRHGRRDRDALRRAGPAADRHARPQSGAGRERVRHAPHVHAVGRQPDSARSSDPRARRGAHDGARVGADRGVPDRRAGFLGAAERERLAALRRARRRLGRYVDLQEAPGARRGAWGVGSIHHLAWRVDDEAHQARLRERVDAAGAPADAGDRSLLVQVGLLPRARRRAVRARHRGSRASPSTKTKRISASRWCCRRGSSRSARRLPPTCRRSVWRRRRPNRRSLSDRRVAAASRS